MQLHAERQLQHELRLSPLRKGFPPLWPVVPAEPAAGNIGDLHARVDRGMSKWTL